MKERQDTMFMLWIFLLQSQSTHQAYELNCLRANPGVVDVTMNSIPQIGNLIATQEEFDYLYFLVSTRFKRVHNFQRDYKGMNLLDGLSHLSKASSQSAQWFLSPSYHHLPWNREETVNLYQEVHAAIQKINSAHKVPLVVGLYLSPLYLHSQSPSTRMHLDAVETVFGVKDHPDLALGYHLIDCKFELKNPRYIGRLRRLQLIACSLDDKRLINFPRIPPPEDYAENVIKICDEIRDIAISLGIPAEIVCVANYPTDKKSSGGIKGSFIDFQRFWCRVTSMLIHNNSHAGIIMESAFDNVFQLYGTSESRGEYNTGWWRKVNLHRNGGQHFVEKVDSLPGGSEYGKCGEACQFCNSSDDCCPQMFCGMDSVFQLLAVPQKVPQICQPKSSFCGITPGSFNPFPPQNPSVWDSTRTIIAIILFPLSGITITSVVAYFIHRRLSSNNSLSQQELDSFFDGNSSSLSDPITAQLDSSVGFQQLKYDKELEIPKSSFEIHKDKLLGRGSFGVVFRGRIGNDDVAVKTILPGANKMNLKDLLLELKVLAYLGQHENIVSLRGAHTTQLTSGKLFLFLELCSLGNLLDFLRSHRQKFSDEYGTYNLSQAAKERQLTCKVLLSWSIQIAQAMEHLAEKRVIHGDIAARNILIFSKDQVKLTDFGLSRRLYENSNYVKSKQVPLPWRHMSVEALQDLSFSLKSDVWAFGVTLWETFSLGEVPYPGLTWTQDYVKLLIEGLRPLRPHHTHPLIYEVISSCWTTEVELRPPIDIVRSKLTSALDELFTHELYIYPSETQ